MDGLPCRGDSAESVGRGTIIGPLDPVTTQRQRLHTNLSVDRELWRDMIKGPGAPHGSSSSQPREQEKWEAHRSAIDEDDIEPSDGDEGDVRDDDVTVLHFDSTRHAAAAPVDAVTESGST